MKKSAKNEKKDENKIYTKNEKVQKMEKIK